MKNRYWGAGSVLLLGFLSMAEGCSSAETVCELICDCIHCSDSDKDRTCLQYKTREAVAEAYDCSTQWEAHMACIQEQGTCNEEESSFVLRGLGSCSETQDIGMTCMSQSDCDAVGFPFELTCTAGRCVAKVCSGTFYNCSSDANCVGSGVVLCTAEEDAVRECVENASGGGGPKFF